MIKQILEMLPDAEATTENIGIAKGKYEEPQNWKQFLKKLKNGY